jgi:protein TonB
MGRFYPEAAARAGVDGWALIECSVEATGYLRDCTVLDERPGGYGFGAATVRAAGTFRMRPRLHDGRPVDGGTVQIPLRWSSPNDAPTIGRELLDSVLDGIFGR